MKLNTKEKGKVGENKGEDGKKESVREMTKGREGERRRGGERDCMRFTEDMSQCFLLNRIRKINLQFWRKG